MLRFPHAISPRPRISLLSAFFLVCTATDVLCAQATDSTGPRWITTINLLGEPAEENRRSALLRSAAPDLSLFRSSSSLAPRLGGDTAAARVALVLPHLRFVTNSALPQSGNDGALWAGRGANVSVTGGIAAEWKALRVFLLPEWTYSQNLDYDTSYSPRFPARPASRNPWSSPFHVGAQSIDLPIRFGNQSLADIGWGQSALVARVGLAELGAATENHWWGPGIRNALILSNNAAGFPHLFARTPRAMETRFGAVEARWIVGGLSGSKFFDDTPGDDFRSIAALGATIRPRGVNGLTLGVARSVFAPAPGWGSALTSFLDVFRDVGSPNAVPVTDTMSASGPDQLFSLFGRWVFPADGLEIYGELGRAELPRSLRDLLTQPNHTQAYSLGLQWLGDEYARFHNRLRLQGEFTYLQQSTTFRFRPLGSWYTSRAVRQGYTHKGQVIGAGIGPGSSSQWFALDNMATSWSAGAYFNRVRSLEDARSQAFIGTVPGNGWCEHDTSMTGGVRAVARTRFGTMSADYGTGWRYNVFFKHDINSCPFSRGTDRRIRSLSITLTPEFPPASRLARPRQ